MKKVMGSIIFEEDELPKEIAISQKAKQLYDNYQYKECIEYVEKKHQFYQK